MKELNAAREKANAEGINTAVYQVLTGASVGTYMTFTMNRSLAEWDEFRAKMADRNKAIDAALGGESVVKERSKRAGEIFADTNVALYALNPSISRPGRHVRGLRPRVLEAPGLGSGGQGPGHQEGVEARPEAVSSRAVASGRWARPRAGLASRP